VLGDAARCAPVIAWSLAQKLEWLARTGRHNDWITAPDHRTFLEASFAAFGESGRRVLFVLRLDEEILATMLSSLDDVRLECFMNVSHPAYGTLSPAQVLREQVLQWAYERGLDCDLRLATSASRRSGATASCRRPIT